MVVLNMLCTKIQHTKKINESNKKINRILFFSIYTILFVITAIAVFACFFSEGKTFIWRGDGWSQHYKALIYYARWLRSIIENSTNTLNLTVPMYSMSMGYGADVLTTLHYYVIGDPLNLLCLLVPIEDMYYLYGGLMLLRLYLAGVSFAAFWMYTKKVDTVGLLAGCFIYVFCGFTLFGAVRHPYFVNPMIYLPLLFLGIEKIVKENKPQVMIGAVFLSAVSNFYFFYMLVLLTILYAVMRMVMLYHRNEMGQAMVTLFRIAGYSVIGALLSCFILVPVIVTFFDNPRRNSEYIYDFFASAQFLEKFPESFIVYEGPGVWTCMGYSALALIFVCFLFIRKKNLHLKVSWIVLTIFLLFPVFGYIFNGCSYVSNRWCWGYSMLIASIVTVMWSSLRTITQKEYSCLTLLSLIYFVVCMALTTQVEKNMKFSMALIGITLVVLIIYVQKYKGWHLTEGILMILLLAGIVGNAYFGYSVNQGNYVDEFKDAKVINEELYDTVDQAVLAVNDQTEFYRYSGNVDKNSTLISDLSSINYYWSLSNSCVFDYWSQLGLLDNTNYRYRTLDNRAALNTLSGVKYFVTEGDWRRIHYIPYQYSKASILDEAVAKKYLLHQNEVALPLAYTYDSYISKELFEQLSPLQRQEAMLQGIMLEKQPSNCVPTNVSLTSQEINYFLTCNSEHITAQGNSFVVTKENSSVTLEFDGLEQAETYLYISGLSYKGTPKSSLYNDDKMIDPMDLYTQEKWNKLSKESKKELIRQEKYWQEPDQHRLRIIASDTANVNIEKELTYYTSRYTWATGRHDFLVHLEYSDAKKTSIKIIFPYIGTYAFNELKVLCQPMAHYLVQVNALRQNVLENINMNYLPVNDSPSITNMITGTIYLDRPKILCMTVPYSSGWKAYVDGNEQPVLKANLMFMGLEVGPGNHQIQFVYCTPGLNIGIFLSMIGAVIFVMLMLSRIHVQKKKQKKRICCKTNNSAAKKKVD